MSDLHLISRRSFLRQTFAFSAVAALRPGAVFAQSGSFARPDPSAQHMFMIGDWGTDKYIDQQKSVAVSMARWMQNNRSQPSSMFLLGDNWYGRLPGGVNDQRWNDQFETMYPANLFPGPAYAVLGNHDYEHHAGFDKVQLQTGLPQAAQDAVDHAGPPLHLQVA